MKVVFARFPQNKYLKILLWVLVFVILTAFLLLLNQGMPDIRQEDVLKAAKNTIQQTDYRWHIKTDISFKGVTNNLSDVKGERAKDSFDLKGTFLKTPLQLIQIKNVTYRLDPISGQWLVIKDNDISTEEVLNTELNPVAALNFSAVNSLNIIGVDEINNQKSYRVTISPQVSSEYLEKYWKNFQYTIWLDKKLQYVIAFEISAMNKKDSTGKIRMKVMLSDFGKPIEIKAPL